MNAKSLDDTYFIKNAIACWLHYYPEHKWVSIYQEMMKRDSFNTQPQPEPIGTINSMDADEPKPKPRPARRRKQTTA